MKGLTLWWMALLLPTLACATEAVSSTTPYQALYEVLSPVRTIRAHDRLVALERVASKSGDVPPQDIRIVIHARAGDIAVPVGADGSVDFPADEALRAENPAVETNQPKGSLSLTVKAGLRVPEALIVKWSEFTAALAQADALYANAPGAVSTVKARGIEIHFKPGTAASVTVQGRSERLLRPDSSGRILVTREMVVDAEQPNLVFSQRAISILPYVDS